MQELVIRLTESISGSPAVALFAAFVWGVLSVLLSPCHLASIPLIVGFIEGQDSGTSGRACWLATMFAVGILVTIAVIGIVTAWAGRIMGDVGRYGNYIVAVIFFAVGLQMLGVIPSLWTKPSGLISKRSGTWSALLLGLISGIALGPCAFAFMAPMLGVTFKVASTSPVYAASLLAAYGIGHCFIIAAAGTSAGMVQQYLNWNSRSGGAMLVRKCCGVLVILGGLYLIYLAP